MRHVNVVLIPEEGALHPAADAIAADPSVRLDAVLHLTLQNDGTVVALSRHRGSADRLAAILDDDEDVIRSDVSAVRDGIQTYVHSVPTETAAELLELTREHEFVIDTPMEFDEDGALRVSVIGEAETVQRAVEDVPDGVRLELEQLSEYDPEGEELVSTLTDRQREILDTAVDVGYYEVPRRATHQDIADALDLSTTTVGEHLRKIEARLVSELVRR